MKPIGELTNLDKQQLMSEEISKLNHQIQFNYLVYSLHEDDNYEDVLMNDNHLIQKRIQAIEIALEKLKEDNRNRNNAK